MKVFSKFMAKLGYVPQAQLDRAVNDLEQAQNSLQSTQSKLSTALSENAVLNRKLALSRRDDMTGLANGKGLDMAYRQLSVQDELDGHVLILADANDLKKVNTELEYDGGDTYLRHISHALTETFPDAIVVSRHGGDEFSVIIKASMEEARKLAEQVEVYVQNTPCFHMEDDYLVTIEGSVATGLCELKNGLMLGENGGAIEMAAQDMLPHKSEMKEALNAGEHGAVLIRPATEEEQERYTVLEMEF